MGLLLLNASVHTLGRSLRHYFVIENSHQAITSFNQYYLQMSSVAQLLTTSLFFVYFLHMFGPYKEYQVLKEQIDEVLMLAELRANEEGSGGENDPIDEIQKRYAALRMDTYSEYLLSEGRGTLNKLFMEA